MRGMRHVASEHNMALANLAGVTPSAHQPSAAVGCGGMARRVHHATWVTNKVATCAPG